MQLNGQDLAHLTRLANVKKMSLERVARLVFLRGMRLLMRVDDAEVPATEEVVRSSKTDYLRDYISLHWMQQSDAQMAEALGYTKSYICIIRNKMGLSRSLRRRKEDAREAMSQLRQERSVQLDGLIREHYATKNDAEIGGMVNPPVSRGVVCERRLKLGLKRLRGPMRVLTVRDQVDAAELERMVVHEGYTMTDYLKVKGIRCTRERLRQIALELGVKGSIENRAPEWETHRRARQLNKPELADKEWFAQEIVSSASLADFQAKIGIDDHTTRFFLRMHGLTHPWQRRVQGRETVEVVCTECEKRYKKTLRWMKHIEKCGGGVEGHRFFCSYKCMGQYRKKHPDKWKRKAG